MKVDVPQPAEVSGDFKILMRHAKVTITEIDQHWERR
jgi:hypothetical protein